MFLTLSNLWEWTGEECTFNISASQFWALLTIFWSLLFPMRGIFGVCEDTGSHHLIYQKASRNLVASCCISGGVRDAELCYLNADDKSGSWSVSGQKFCSREYLRLDVAIWGRILFHDSCLSLDGLRTFSCKHLLTWIVDLLCAIFPSFHTSP